MATKLSAEVTATTELPAASGVSASASSGSQIVVSWTVNDDSPDGGIDVERSTDGFSTATTVASGLSPTTSSYTDPSPPLNTAVEYRIERNTDHATATSGGSPPVGIGTAAVVGATSSSLAGRVSSVIGAAGTTPATGSEIAAQFTADGAFGGGVTPATGVVIGSQQLISAVQARTQSAAGVVGSAAFVGSLSRTVESAASVAPATVGVTPAPAVVPATTTPVGSETQVDTSGGRTSTAGAPAAASGTVSTSGGRATATAAVTLGGRIPGWALRLPSEFIPLRPDETAITAEQIALTTTATPQNAVAPIRARDVTDVDSQEGFGGAARFVDNSGRAPVEIGAGQVADSVVGLTDVFLTGLDTEETAPGKRAVDLQLQRTEIPVAEDVTEMSDTDWLIEREDGSGAVGFARDTFQPVQRPDTGLELVGRCTTPQAAAVHDLFPRVRAAVERSVPDGPDFWADTTPDNSLSVTLSVPTDADASLAGEYVVAEWELVEVGVGDRPWELTLVLQRG